MTHAIPKIFWDEWLANNQDSLLVKNGLVFAASSEARALDQAKEQRELLSGLEPIDASSAEAIRKRVGKDRLPISTLPGAGALGKDIKDVEPSMQPLQSAWFNRR